MMLNRSTVLIAATAALPLLAACAPADATASQTRVIASCTAPKYEPKQIILACADGGALLKHATWTSWTAGRAQGAAIFSHEVCKPSCVDGHWVNVPARITLVAAKDTKKYGELFTKVRVRTATKTSWYYLPTRAI